MHGEFRTRFQAPDGWSEMEQIALACEGAIAMNMAYFQEHPDAPCCLGCAGVYYEEPPKCEVWCQYVDTAPMLLAKGRATCMSVVCYDVAMKRMGGALDLTESGIPIWAAVAVMPELDEAGKVVPHSFHVLVTVPTIDGDELSWREFDPTAELITAPGQCQGSCPIEETP